MLLERYALHEEGYERVITDHGVGDAVVAVSRWQTWKRDPWGSKHSPTSWPTSLERRNAYAVHCTGFHYAVVKCSLLPFSGLGSLSSLSLTIRRPHCQSWHWFKRDHLSAHIKFYLSIALQLCTSRLKLQSCGPGYGVKLTLESEFFTRLLESDHAAISVLQTYVVSSP